MKDKGFSTEKRKKNSVRQTSQITMSIDIYYEMKLNSCFILSPPSQGHSTAFHALITQRRIILDHVQTQKKNKTGHLNLGTNFDPDFSLFLDSLSLEEVLLGKY